MLKKGDILADRYEVVSFIDGGGMSRVYLVKDLRLETQWALKEFSYTAGSDTEKRQLERSFVKEAKVCARLSHPGIARVVDFFSIEDRHYLVEEFIEGETLLKKIQRAPLTVEETITIAMRLTKILTYIHDQGIVYRDLKPDNVMIKPDGSVKLLDFGIARVYKSDQEKDTVILGTPGFAAPEQYGTSQTDQRSDIYSLGALIHHALTGRDPREKPFDFDNPSTMGITISPAMENIIMKALSLKKENRYSSITEMEKDMKEAYSGNKTSVYRKNSGNQALKSKAAKFIKGREKPEKSSNKVNTERESLAKKISFLVYGVVLFMLVSLLIEMRFRIWVLIPYFLVAWLVVFLIYRLWESKNKVEDRDNSPPDK